ncbi:hypothetical protein KUTeg_014017 [Tegillarca granosa]|uniref:Uncharacterized protein n=1 Tax=Tegillarca granosa TaxID=220873 RepID=A0ABQ9EVE0_TEGGR|nr:hypothetical protein KUTeg_014017 [Tegillarca granosa]
MSEKSDRESQKRTAKNSKISNAAKRVTDRLYTAPPPKFKREAKEKKPASGKSTKDVTRKKDDKEGSNEDDRKRRAGTPRKSPMREDIGKISKSPSTKRKSGDSSSNKVTTPVTQGKKKAGTPERVTQQEKEKSPSLSSRSRPSSSSNQAKSKTPNKDNKAQHTLPSSHVKRSATPPGLGHDYQAQDDIKSQQNIKITMSSPDLRLLSKSPTPADRNGRIFVSRMPATKLRHMASTPSLASVPEAVGEEGDAIEMPTSPETAMPQVVKRRNRRHIEGEKYKRHSAPVGEILANIFQNSGFSFTDNMETDEILTSNVQPVEDLNCSSNTISGENMTLTSSDVSDSDGGIQFTVAQSSGKVCPEDECVTNMTEDIGMECDSEISIDQNTKYLSSAVFNINTDQDLESTNIDKSGNEVNSKDLEMITADMGDATKCGDVQMSDVPEHSECLTYIPVEMQQVGKICIENSETNKVMETLPENSASSVVFAGVRSEAKVEFICPTMDDRADEVDGNVCEGKHIKPGNKREISETGSSVIAAKCRKEDSRNDNVETLTSQQPSLLDMLDESNERMLTVEQESVGPQTHQHHIDFMESLEFGHSQGILHAVSSTEDVIVCEDIRNVISDQNTQNFVHKDSDDRFSSDSLDSDPERKPKDKNIDDVSSDSLNVSGNSDIMDSLSPKLSNDDNYDIPPSDQLHESSNGNNTQLSSARKAVRQRAVIRQKQLGCNEESDDIDQLSDDPLSSESQPKSLSRPELTSRRRRRINNKSDRKAKRWRGLSSEEYITSDSDGIYSDNSLTGQVEFSSGDNANSDNVTGENGPSDVHWGNYTPAFVSNLSDSDTKITVELTGCFLSSQKMERSQFNGFRGTSELTEETKEKLHENKTIDGSESHSRSSSETRSVQTDISLIGNGNFEAQNSDGYYSDLAVSPLCIWSSGDKKTQYHQPHSKRTPKTKVEYCVRKNKHPKQERLAISVTDQWSAETSTSRKKSASSVSSDSSYVMEMETLSPQLPSPSDRFIQEGQTSPPQDMSCFGTTFPVVYEVTVREDLTNVFYNVDRTEIKTYGLRSQTNGDGAQIIPDSININLQETTTNTTEKKSETIYKEEVTFRNSDHQDSPVDSVISETNFRSVSDFLVENPGTDQEVCKEHQVIVENSDRYIHPHCEGNIQNIHDPETLISPRESDTTSDYGTLVESKLGNSSCLSGSQSTIPGDLEYSPMDDSVFHKSTEESNNNEFSFDTKITPESVTDLQVGINNIPQSVGESINYISVQGQQLCHSEDTDSPQQLRPGNVFDEDNFDAEEHAGNNTEQEFVNSLSKDSEEYEGASYNSQDNLKQETGEISLSGSEEIEYEEERSLSPGEIVLKPNIITSSELYQTFASGLISMDETGAMENQDGTRQLDFRHKGYKEKSPSLSELNEHKETEDYRRSMSENCIDQYEERTNSSNESIVFVFMGQSHTNESMEELKSFTSSHKEYKVHEDEEEKNNTNDDSNITNEENDQNVSDIAEEDQHRRNMSRSVSESENSVDTSPLRHRYGIDSNVLPIPERSISSDNLPKGSSDQPGIHRSRSADMLAVGVIEDPTGNEGVFPPCFNGDTSGSNEENMMSVNSVDSKTSVGESDKILKDEIVKSTQEVLYAEIETAQTERVKPQEVNYEGHISDDEIITLTKTSYKPESADRGVTTGVEKFSPVVSVGVQVSLSNSSTQTDSSYNSLAEEFLPLNVLPALESDYRAQSMVNIGEAPGPAQLNLSEGTEEWYNLSHMVLENKTILKNINQNIPGMNVQQNTDSSVCTANNQDDSTQTGGSLINLQSSGIQTDELFDFEEQKNESCASTTQTGSGLVSLLEIAEVESTDYQPSPPPKTFHDMSIQTVDFTPESAQTREISIQTVETGPSESDMKFDFSKNVPSESKIDDTETRNVRQNHQQILKSSSEIKQHDWHHYEEEQEEPQGEIITETIVYNTSEAPETRQEKVTEKRKKHESKKSDDQVVVTEREFRLATEVELPDLETSNAQMEALKEEHSKMMASLKKAANDRKERVEASKNNKRLSASITRAELETLRKEMENEASDSNKSDIQSSSEDLKSENVESYSRPLTQEEFEILMKNMARKASTDVTNIDKMPEGYRSRERNSWENRKASTVTGNESRYMYDEKKNEKMSYDKSDLNRKPVNSAEEVKYSEIKAKDRNSWAEKENSSITSTVSYDKSDLKGKPVTSVEKVEYSESKVKDRNSLAEKENSSITSTVSYDKSDLKGKPVTSVEKVEYSESKVKDRNSLAEKENSSITSTVSYDKSDLKGKPVTSVEKVEYSESKVKDRNSLAEKENSSITSTVSYDKSKYDEKKNQNLSSTASVMKYNKSECDKIRPTSPEDEVEYSESTFYIYNIESENISDEDNESTDKEENPLHQQDKHKDEITKNDADKLQQEAQHTEGTTYYSYPDTYTYNSSERQENQPNRNAYEINKANNTSEKDLPSREISHHREEEVIHPSVNQRVSNSSPWEMQRAQNEVNSLDMKESKKDEKKQTTSKMSDGAILNQKIMSVFAEQDSQTRKQQANYHQVKKPNVDTSEVSGYREEIEDVLSDTIGSPTCGTPPNSPLAQGDEITNRFTMYNDSQITVDNSDKSDSSDVVDSSLDKSKYETMYSESIIPKSSLQDTTRTKPQESDSYNTIKLYVPKKKNRYDKSATESTTEDNNTSQYSTRALNTNTALSSQPRYSEMSTLPSQELIMPSLSTRSYISQDNVRENSYISQDNVRDNKVSTGVEVCVDSSDDFTQTDLRLDLTGDRGMKESKTNNKIKEDLERLQKERVEIIELLSLNYLPSSLTIELLERKLNYCIGQTDLLLESLGENLDFEIHELNITSSHDTREYISNYKESLRQSKRDIEICKERMDRRRGTGRGRTIGRNRDLFRLRRNAEIEVFKAERSIEQLKHRQEKTVNPWKNISASIHDRFDRSSRDVSPSSTSSTPRTMTPKQHRDHLIELRRQLVKATKDEDFRQRSCRSSSPVLTKTERDRYLGSSYKYTDRTRDRSAPLSTHYEGPIDHKTDVSYGVSSYVMPPSYAENLQAPRSYSYDVTPSSSDFRRYDRSSSPYYSNYDYLDSQRYHSVDSSRTYVSPTYDNIPFYRSSDQHSNSPNSSFGDGSYRYHSVDRSDRSHFGTPGIDTRHHSLETNYQLSVNNYTHSARSQSVDSRHDKTSHLYSSPLSREQSPHSIQTSFGAKYHSTGLESPTQQLMSRSRSKVESRVYSPTQGLLDVQTKSSKTEHWYDSETEALLKEIREMKQQNQQEILRAKDNLVTYRRESGSAQGDKQNAERKRLDKWIVKDEIRVTAVMDMCNTG